MAGLSSFLLSFPLSSVSNSVNKFSASIANSSSSSSKVVITDPSKTATTTGSSAHSNKTRVRLLMISMPRTLQLGSLVGEIEGRKMPVWGNNCRSKLHWAGAPKVALVSTFDTIRIWKEGCWYYRNLCWLLSINPNSLIEWSVMYTFIM